MLDVSPAGSQSTMTQRTEMGLGGVPGFVKFWWAASVSEFGTYVTSVAMAVLIKYQLHGTASDQGWVTAARWLPYAVFGLLAGVLIDRVRRRPVQVSADLARAVLLTAISVFALTGDLSIAALAAMIAIFGLASLAGDAASLAFLPRIVPADHLTRAHARIDQSSALAQTSGPALAGGILFLIGAPLALLVDGASYLFSGLVLLTIRVHEPLPPRASRRRIRTEMAEGLRWIYRHPTLAPLALSGHFWFLCWGISGVVLPFFVLDTARLGTAALDTLALGIAGSLAGIGALIGSLFAFRLGLRFGAGRVVVICRAVMPVAYLTFALASPTWPGRVLIGLGHLLIGLAMGAENANEMGYQQTVTPDALQGRMNATKRSINRAVLVIAAPAGGMLAVTLGYRPTMVIIGAGFAAGALALGLSPFWSARLEPASVSAEPVK